MIIWSRLIDDFNQIQQSSQHLIDNNHALTSAWLSAEFSGVLIGICDHSLGCEAVTRWRHKMVV